MSTASMARVAVVTSPYAECALHPQGVDRARAVTVYADDDGMITFSAVRGGVDGARTLSLDCTPMGGGTVTYSIDLTRASTFEPPSRPVPRNVRPALTGDPLAYSQSELIRGGYGVRPDPAQAPNFYADWLDSASKPAKQVEAPPLPVRSAIPPQSSPNWGGQVLDQPGVQYVLSFTNYTLPNAVVFNNANMFASLWGGLGGATMVVSNNDFSLIQCGAELIASPFFGFAVYEPWKQYFSPFDSNQGQGGNAAPIAMNMGVGDTIRTESWVCNAQGNVDPNGGFGCFWMANNSANPPTVVSCTNPNNGCTSIPRDPRSPFVGGTAEFIVEKVPNNLLAQYNTFTMSTAAMDMNGRIHDFSTDNSAYVELTNASNTADLESGLIAGSESVQFTFFSSQ